MTHNFALAVPYSAVIASGTANLEFKTPKTGTIKIKAAAHSTGASHKVELIEAPTLTTGAAAVTPINKDRASTVKSFATVKSNPTTISAGTVIDTAFSHEIDPTEYTLKANTVYLIKVTNTEAAAKDITVLVDYEEIDVSYEYTVTFTVTDDAEPGVAIKDASITYAGETKSTAADGTASFTARPATYTYTVSKTGKVTQAGTQAVTNAAVAKAIALAEPAAAPGPSVTFTVTDSIFGLPIEGASIVLGINDAVVTDENGIAIIEDQTAAEGVAYSATLTGYTITSGTVDIAEDDVLEHVSAALDVYTVTFTITLDDDPVEYARIDFRGYTQRTNSEGVLAVDNVIPGEYAYTAMYNGGYYVTGTVTVEALDVDEAVALTVPE